MKSEYDSINPEEVEKIEKILKIRNKWKEYQDFYNWRYYQME